MAVLCADSVEVVCVAAFIKRIVARQFVGAEDLTLDPQRTESERLVGKIIENIAKAILHGLADETDQPPWAAFPIGPGRIERLSDVGPVARRHKALQVKGKVLQ